MGEIILYTTHCPKCNVLKMKLDAKKIEYKEVDDVDVMLDMGLMAAPVLDVCGEMKEFADACKWVDGVSDAD